MNKNMIILNENKPVTRILMRCNADNQPKLFETFQCCIIKGDCTGTPVTGYISGLGIYCERTKLIPVEVTLGEPPMVIKVDGKVRKFYDEHAFWGIKRSELEAYPLYTANALANVVLDDEGFLHKITVIHNDYYKVSHSTFFCNSPFDYEVTIDVSMPDTDCCNAVTGDARGVILPLSDAGKTRLTAPIILLSDSLFSLFWAVGVVDTISTYGVGLAQIKFVDVVEGYVYE